MFLATEFLLKFILIVMDSFSTKDASFISEFISSETVKTDDILFLFMFKSTLQLSLYLKLKKSIELKIDNINTVKIVIVVLILLFIFYTLTFKILT